MCGECTTADFPPSCRPGWPEDFTLLQAELPARLEVTLALRFDIEPLDYGVHQHIAVHIIDEDNAEMVNVRATPISFESPKTPGLPVAYDLILPLTVGFPREGTWTFDVRVNERVVARVPLRVERR